MYEQFENNEPQVKNHVTIVIFYAVIMFEGHAPSHCEWTSAY